MTFSPDNVFVIGVGGTGGHISAPLARLIAYHENTKNSKLTFIDGDEFEEKNTTRQIVAPSQVGLNKANAMRDFCMYQGLSNVDYKPEFISTSTFIPLLRQSNSPLVVVCVDNDASRLAIINAIKSTCTNKDFFFITPGNSDGTEEVKGQTLWYGRIDGVDVGTNPADVYPNIENPNDSIPHSGSCALHAPSRPQLIAANLMAASITLMVIQNLLDGYLDQKQSSMFFNLRNLKTSAC
jgi:hypothetical protein